MIENWVKEECTANLFCNLYAISGISANEASWQPAAFFRDQTPLAWFSHVVHLVKQIGSEEEYSSLDLGDVRLNRRAMQFVSESAGIGNSNPDRCRAAGSLKALYRTTENSKVDVGKLFEAHNDATIKRCSERSLVYLLQDTTEVDLTKPQTEIAGVGPLSTGNLAESETALAAHRSANVEDQNDPWGNPYHIVDLAAGVRVISLGPNGTSPRTGFDQDDIYSDIADSPSEALIQAKQRKLILCLSLPVVWLVGSIGYFFICKRSR